MGTLALIAGPLTIWKEQSIGIDVIAFYAVTWVLAVVFLRYGIKGRSDGINLSRRQNVLVRLPLGLLYIAFGMFLLIAKYERWFGVFAGALLVVLGLASLRMVYESRKIGRAA
jgi:hypothetical protein